MRNTRTPRSLQPLDVACELGESPRWDADRGAFLWLDVPAGALWSWRPDGAEPQRRTLPGPTTSLALTTEHDALLISTYGALALLRGASSTALVAPPLRPGQRFNDSGVDPAGRLWIATLTPSKEPVNGLFEYVPGQGLQRRDDGLRAGNGIAWSPGGDTMYVVDSGERSILRYERNPVDGRIGRRGLLARFREDEGVPDGLAVDRDGTVWCAMWGGAALVRLTADGALAERISLPVAYPSSCAFGGDDMSLLLVTSARRGEVREEGHDGRPLLLEPGSAGFPANRVALPV